MADSIPNDRSSFRVAVLCALSLEFRAMAAALDMDFTKRAYRKRFGKVEGDSNTYKPGRIGDHDVVIIQLPGSGKESAATASALARVSYPNIKLAFVVGVCAGAPKDFKGEDIILGDVLISTHVFQTDHARIHDSGMKPYENVEEVLGRAPKPIRSFLKACLAEIGTIQEDVEKSVETLLQDCPQDSTYPGREKDKLLENQHRHSETSKCKQCQEDPASCQAAQEASCAKLGCDDAYLECRERLKLPTDKRADPSSDKNPSQTAFSTGSTNSLAPPHSTPPSPSPPPGLRLHFGRIASADQLIRSSSYRKELIDKSKVIGFEMEGAGVWDNIPTVVVKGVSDYADSHKNKVFQDYAAVSAAACAKVLLGRLELEDLPLTSELTCQGDSVEPVMHDITQAQEKQELEALRRLGPATYLEHKAWISDRVQGTCNWVLRHPYFQAWCKVNIQEAVSPRVLWVSGDPGSGKSVLAKSLIDNELKSSKASATCFFFFKDDDVGRRSVLNAIKALLHQLFTQQRSLLRYATSTLEPIRKGEENFPMLWDILLKAASNWRDGIVVCVLDALDECEKVGRAQLIQSLQHLYYRNEGTLVPSIKFFITCRPYVDIERRFLLLLNQAPFTRISGEDDLESIKQEVDHVISVRVQQLTWLREEVRCLLHRELIKVENRTYLWVTLVFDVIFETTKITEKNLPNLLSTLPNTVEKAYESILAKNLDIPKARRLLNIVIAAKRPLTLREMNIALNIGECCQSFDDLDFQMTEEELKTEIRNLCGLFVVVMRSEIHLIHLTAKEFLILTTNSASPCEPTRTNNTERNSVDENSLAPEVRWAGTFTLQEANFILAQICVWYGKLLYIRLEKDTARRFAESKTNLEGDEEFAFRGYALRFWADHYRSGAVPGNSQLAGLSWAVFQSSMRSTNLHSAERRTFRYSRFLGSD